MTSASFDYEALLDSSKAAMDNPDERYFKRYVDGLNYYMKEQGEKFKVEQSMSDIALQLVLKHPMHRAIIIQTKVQMMHTLRRLDFV